MNFYCERRMLLQFKSISRKFCVLHNQNAFIDFFLLPLSSHISHDYSLSKTDRANVHRTLNFFFLPALRPVTVANKITK